MVKKSAFIITLCVAVTGCAVPPEAYYNRASPESLIDISTESINTKLRSPASVQEIVDAINKHQPSRAEVRCNQSESLCKETLHVMNQFSVPVKYTQSDANTVSLIYQYTMTRNCQNRYIDNVASANNYYNLDSPTMGCSVAVNIVQEVTDKHEFTNPKLLGPQDASGPLQAMSTYYKAGATSMDPSGWGTLVEGSSR